MRYRLPLLSCLVPSRCPPVTDDGVLSNCANQHVAYRCKHRLHIPGGRVSLSVQGGGSGKWCITQDRNLEGMSIRPRDDTLDLLFLEGGGP